MPDPVVIRVTRPYRDLSEYLKSEASTIDARGMLLIGAEPLPKNTVVKFLVGLTSGEQLIRAEGVAREFIAPSPSSPGGLRVRFKRFGVATKAVIDQAVKARQNQVDLAPASSHVDSVAHWTSHEIGSEPGPSTMRSAEPSSVRPSDPPASCRLEGLRSRHPGQLVTPPNRDALLARLRERALA